MAFCTELLISRLAEMTSSQDSVQCTSLWLIHYRKHHKLIVEIWFQELRRAKPYRKLVFMHLANDVIQRSKKKGLEYGKEFYTILSKAFVHISRTCHDEKSKCGVERIIDIWEARRIYDRKIIREFRDLLPATANDGKTVSKGKTGRLVEKSKPIVKEYHPESYHMVKERKSYLNQKSEVIASTSHVNEPPDPETLIKIMRSLENAPSIEAMNKGKLASLPLEVTDVSAVDKIKSLESAKELARKVENAKHLVDDVNSRLDEELETRNNLSQMLSSYIQHEKECLANSIQQLEEYQGLLNKVNRVKSKLKYQSDEE